MAKFLENDNESPEVDLKNLTVKLAGMGLDEEIEEVIPGKKDSKDYKTADDADDSSKDSDESDKEEPIEEKSSEEEIEESEEVSEFYEKRAAERDLTLEKVEELAEEMESSEGKKQKGSSRDNADSKSEKKQTEKNTSQKTKRKKLDGVAIIGIVLAIAALIGGGIWLYRASNQEPNLKITLNMFFKQYRGSKIYESIFQMGFDCPEPSYRDEEVISSLASSGSSAEPASTTAVSTSKYRYFDFVVSGRVREGIQEPVFVSGCECKDNNYLKNMRFFAPMKDESDLQVYYVVYSAFLQAFYTDVRSEDCLEKVKNAYNQSIASTEAAVMVKDGDLAYSVTKAQIDGSQYFVMDIVPVKEADKFVFATKMYQEPNLRMTERSFRALYYSTPLYADVLLQFGFQFRGVHYAGEPYQETAAQASADAATVTPTPVPTPIPSSSNTKYRFFDNASIGSISQDWPVVTVSIVGCENKGDHFMRWVRFYAPLEMENDAEIDVYAIIYGAFLQSLYSGTDSDTCLKKVQNTFLDFYNSEDKTPKMVKDGHLAYSVRIEEIDGQRSFVMDVVPVEEADTFNFAAPYSN